MNPENISTPGEGRDFVDRVDQGVPQAEHLKRYQSAGSPYGDTPAGFQRWLAQGNATIGVGGDGGDQQGVEPLDIKT